MLLVRVWRCLGHSWPMMLLWSPLLIQPHKISNSKSLLMQIAQLEFLLHKICSCSTLFKLTMQTLDLCILFLLRAGFQTLDYPFSWCYETCRWLFLCSPCGIFLIPILPYMVCSHHISIYRNRLNLPIDGYK